MYIERLNTTLRERMGALNAEVARWHAAPRRCSMGCL